MDKKINSSNFWDDKTEAENNIKEYNSLKNIINPMMKIKTKLDDNLKLLEELQENDELVSVLEEEYGEISEEYEKIKVITYLSGDYDNGNCTLEIHAGAGGTESQDWANMLYRMYVRYCKNKGYDVQELDRQDGEEVGIKSVLISVKGEYAYGYLKGEKGVHRLVRISPFDAGKRRHTSFASVEIIPEFKDNIKIDINENDLKIDVYRSSGAGGQSVNTTDSAVRITHIPTGIVVTCQNERSQIQNKEHALEIVKNKLYNLELEKQNEKLKDITKGQMAIAFGSGKRSYVMCPYTLVKDHDTGYETSDVYAVLDGEIEEFIKEGIMK